MEAIYRIESIRATGARGTLRSALHIRSAEHVARLMIEGGHYYKVSVYRYGAERAELTLTRPALNPDAEQAGRGITCGCDVRECLSSLCGRGLVGAE